MSLHLNLCWAALAGMFCSCGLPDASAQSTTNSPGLKLWFDFEEDFSTGQVTDVSGNGHTGYRFCITNWITATNGVFGGTGAAWHTNGIVTNDTVVEPISQYIGVTNLAGIAYLTNGTISLWAQFGQGSSASTMMLDAGYSVQYATYPSLASNSWSLRRSYRPYLSFIVFDATAEQRTLVDWPTDVVQPGGPNPDLSTTNFHLYTITFSCPSNQAIAYYDGQPFMTNSIDLPWLRFYCSTPWLAIGTMAHDGTPQWGDDLYPHSGFFDGRMDDIRIYNRTLSATEVRALYTPAILSMTLHIERAGPGFARLWWNTRTGTSYQIESCQDLTTVHWSPVGSPQAGTGTNNAVIVPLVEQETAFYRVHLVP